MRSAASRAALNSATMRASSSTAVRHEALSRASSFASSSDRPRTKDEARFVLTRSSARAKPVHSIRASPASLAPARSVCSASPSVPRAKRMGAVATFTRAVRSSARAVKTTVRSTARGWATWSLRYSKPPRRRPRRTARQRNASSGSLSSRVGCRDATAANTAVCRRTPVAGAAAAGMPAPKSHAPEKTSTNCAASTCSAASSAAATAPLVVGSAASDCGVDPLMYASAASLPLWKSALRRLAVSLKPPGVGTSTSGSVMSTRTAGRGAMVAWPRGAAKRSAHAADANMNISSPWGAASRVVAVVARRRHLLISLQRVRALLAGRESGQSWVCSTIRQLCSWRRLTRIAGAARMVAARRRALARCSATLTST
eukprot:scaffold64115_cov65-Phaeocystis_antarctica.AAC.7